MSMSNLTASGVYIVYSGGESQHVADRTQAVTLAKRMSHNANEPVEVQRRDGGLKMEFQRGKMTRFRSVR